MLRAPRSLTNSFRALLGAGLSLLILTTAAAVDIVRDLAGDWDLVENYRAVDDPGNARRFSITRVVMSPSEWADGQFDLRFEGASSPTRGYFSLKTGRVWIKTQRRVNRRSTSVEYMGNLKADEAVIWAGLANTNNRELIWGFEARRVAAPTP